jgi:hypothetical protein
MVVQMMSMLIFWVVMIVDLQVDTNAEISYSHGVVYEEGFLLGCCTM